jgi:hypothetical protein
MPWESAVGFFTPEAARAAQGVPWAAHSSLLAGVLASAALLQILPEQFLGRSRKARTRANPKS